MEATSLDNQASPVGRSRGARIGTLLFLSAFIGALHVALFSALDTVAPLGAGHVDDGLIVIRTDEPLPGSGFGSSVLDSLVADAR